MTECPICLDTNEIIRCDRCNKEVCINCIIKYYKTNYSKDYYPICCYCNKKYNYDILNKIKNNKEYEQIRKDYIYKQNENTFNNYVEIVKNRKIYNKYKDIIDKISLHETPEEIIEEINNKEDKDKIIIALQIKYGLYKNKDKVISKHKCPVVGCIGVLNVKSSNKRFVKCDTCNKEICINCMIEKSKHKIENKRYKCDEDQKKSIQMIRTTTKKCPNCGYLIYKDKGCDVMFCTNCHIKFDWNTLNIIIGVYHNPELEEYTKKLNNNITKDNDILIDMLMDKLDNKTQETREYIMNEFVTKECIKENIIKNNILKYINEESKDDIEEETEEYLYKQDQVTTETKTFNEVITTLNRLKEEYKETMYDIEEKIRDYKELTKQLYLYIHLIEHEIREYYEEKIQEKEFKKTVEKIHKYIRREIEKIDREEIIKECKI